MSSEVASEVRNDKVGDCVADFRGFDILGTGDGDRETILELGTEKETKFLELSNGLLGDFEEVLSL